MKRLADLTIEDLTAAPVWRYEGGSGEDAVVVAESRDYLSRMDDEVFLASTDFILPDSERHLGFCFPVDDAGLDYLQPVIVTGSGQVRFWFERALPPEDLSRQWSALGKKGEEVFPIHFSCRVPVDGRTVAGVIADVETSADPSPSDPVELAAAASEAEEEIPRRARRSASASARTEKARVRRPRASGLRVLEKRAPRRTVEMMVDFDLDGLHGNGVTRDVSGTGMFVRSAQPPGVGPSLNLTLRLAEGRTILLKGKVVRSAAVPGVARPTGFGVRLTQKSDDYDSFLWRLLDDR
jgi:hypothetical protein